MIAPVEVHEVGGEFSNHMKRTRLEGLSHLDQLRELVVDHNKIKQFDEESFAGLRCLRELRVEDNANRHLGVQLTYASKNVV